MHQHIHVELPGLVLPMSKPAPVEKDPGAVKALKNLKSFKDKVQTEIKKYRGGRIHPRPRRHAQIDDFARLARRLCGQGVGLVLGGGGARGLAHLVSR